MSIFSMLLHSFYDPRAYARAIANWGVLRFLVYFIFISALSATAIVFSSREAIDEICENEIASFAKLSEGISIDKGRITPTDTEPRFVKNAEGVAVAAISGRALTPEESKGIMVAIEGDAITMQMANSTPVSTPLSELVNSQDTPVQLIELIPTSSQIKYAMLPLVAFTVEIFSNVFYVFVMGVAAFIMSIVNFPKLGIAGSLKFATLAITPAVLVKALVMLILGTPLDGFLFALLSCGMMLFVFSAWRKKMLPKK